MCDVLILDRLSVNPVFVTVIVRYKACRLLVVYRLPHMCTHAQLKCEVKVEL